MGPRDLLRGHRPDATELEHKRIKELLGKKPKSNSKAGPDIDDEDNVKKMEEFEAHDGGPRLSCQEGGPHG